MSIPMLPSADLVNTCATNPDLSHGLMLGSVSIYIIVTYASYGSMLPSTDPGILHVIYRNKTYKILLLTV